MQTPLGPALRQYKTLYDGFLAARRDYAAHKKGSAARVLDLLKELQRFNTKTYPQAAAELKRSIGGGG